MMSQELPTPANDPSSAQVLDQRIWLELAAAGLAGLAAMAPAAREAIDMHLDQAIRSRPANDPMYGLLTWLRLEIASDPAEVRLTRQLEDAILSSCKLPQGMFQERGNRGVPDAVEAFTRLTGQPPAAATVAPPAARAKKPASPRTAARRGAKTRSAAAKSRKKAAKARRRR